MGEGVGEGVGWPAGPGVVTAGLDGLPECPAPAHPPRMPNTATSATAASPSRRGDQSGHKRTDRPFIPEPTLLDRLCPVVDSVVMATTGTAVLLDSEGVELSD